jgi:hypothetical protein
MMRPSSIRHRTFQGTLRCFVGRYPFHNYTVRRRQYLPSPLPDFALPLAGAPGADRVGHSHSTSEVEADGELGRSRDSRGRFRAPPVIDDDGDDTEVLPAETSFEDEWEGAGWSTSQALGGGKNGNGQACDLPASVAATAASDHGGSQPSHLATAGDAGPVPGRCCEGSGREAAAARAQPGGPVRTQPGGQQHRLWRQLCGWVPEVVDERDRVGVRHYRDIREFMAHAPAPLVPGESS